MTDSIIEIMTADTSDFPEILALQKSVFLENALRYNDFTIEAMTQTVGDLIDEAKSNTFFKAVTNIGTIGQPTYKIVGSVRGCPCGDHSYIGRLFVHPDYQNLGIGRRLIAAIEDALNDSRYELTVGHLDAKNIQLYTKLGFRPCREEIINDKLTLIHMEKLIDRGECGRIAGSK